MESKQQLVEAIHSEKSKYKCAGIGLHHQSEGTSL